MTKLRAALLAGSLTANVALVAWWLVRDRPAAAAPAPSLAATVIPVDAPFLAPAALQEHLTQLRLPPATIAAAVRARIYARHDTRRRELLAAAATSTPWWKAANRTGPGDPLRLLAPAQRKELHDLEAAARAATLAQLGPAALDPDGKIAARYSFLTPEKAVLLEALESDYRNLTAELRDEMRGLTTASDREKEKLLATERQRDLATLLSPAELDALGQRTAPTASRLAPHMMAMQATEEEYRAIYAAQKALDEKFPAAYAAGTPASERPTAAARAEFDRQLRAALTPERFAEWETSGQIHASALARLALVNNLPAQTVRDVTALMTATADHSWRISQANDLTVEQRVASLAQLAKDTRAQVSAKLGPDTATAYLRDVFWMDTIANGGAVHLTGGGMAIRNLVPRPPSTPAPSAAPRE